jgi:hypothetical protein
MFCVQADNKCKGNRTFDEIKANLIDSKNRCEGVVLTGGEVTIRNDFLEIVAYAKKLGYESIQIQSNGRMFSSMEFCKSTEAFFSSAICRARASSRYFACANSSAECFIFSLRSCNSLMSLSFSAANSPLDSPREASCTFNFNESYIFSLNNCYFSSCSA